MNAWKKFKNIVMILGFISSLIAITTVGNERVWKILDRAGDLLLIVAVLLMALLLLTGGRRPSAPRYGEVISKAFKDGAANLGRSVVGVLCALSCAVLWALSYTSYRSPALASLSSLEIGVPIYLVATVTLYLLSLAFRPFPLGSPQAPKVVSPLASGKGVALVLGNTLEVLCLVGAMQFITAGQTIALYKVNPLFLLLLLLLVNRERSTRASVAAVFVVLLGALLILRPDFTGAFDPAGAAGSGLAILGGFSFAVFTLALYNYPLNARNSTFSQRLAFMGTVFLLSTILLGLVATFTHSIPDYSKDALTVLVLNGVRVGVVYALYNEAINRIHPVLVAGLVALEVPLTMVFEYFWLDQGQGGMVLSGTVLILIGIVSIIFENDRFRARRDADL